VVCVDEKFRKYEENFSTKLETIFACCGMATTTVKWTKNIVSAAMQDVGLVSRKSIYQKYF
jgi:hypothetical protein